MKVTTFRPKLRDAFRDLNLQWIREHFKVEKKDLEQLENPEAIRAGGGEVFFVTTDDGEAVATAAMIRISGGEAAGADGAASSAGSGGAFDASGPGGEASGGAAGAPTYELAKMAVRPDQRGKKLGDLLMKLTEAWARERKAQKIVLISNTDLEPAIALYLKHGYTVTKLGQNPDYERGNIEMEKILESEQ